MGITAEQALAVAKAGIGTAIVSRHVREERMMDRNVAYEDIWNAIRTATKAKEQDNGTWRLYGGTDIDGDELIVAVELRQTPYIIVTVM